MKDLATKVVKGQTFHPVYLVNVWGSDGWFIGTDYKQTDWGTHSIEMQTDHQIKGPFKATALWPDGSVSTVHVKLLRTEPVEICDMGSPYRTSTQVFGVVKKLNGVKVEVLADKLMFDLSTIEEG
jgi:hypothetical protein